MTDWKNKLYFGDNLDILREHVPDESVDLVYLDPPFNSNATYNVLFKEAGGEGSAAQIQAFDDTWHWSMDAEFAYQDVVTDGPRKLADLLQAMRSFLGQNDMMAYLTMMAQRMVELHRVLKPTGSIYLHCDPTASHYLKLLMDSVFGSTNFRSQITWKRTTVHSDSKDWSSVTDTILYYVFDARLSFRWHPRRLEHSQEYVAGKYRHQDEDGRVFALDNMTSPNPRPNMMYEWKGFPSPPMGWRYEQATMERLDAEGRIWYPDSTTKRPRLKRYLDEMPGALPTNIWTDIPPINSQANERLGYPTQKPEALLERIIEASSNEGDVVLDPFCGCGTAVAVAERLKRRWIGIDITHIAVSLMKYRLRDGFGDQLSPYDVIGVPRDTASARALAQESEHDGRYQFEYWALGLVDARPGNNRRRGADAGVDGYINFFDGRSGKAKTVIVQVKSGRVERSQIATLNSDRQREKAEVALFVTLQPPTRPMVEEAAGAGVYQSEVYPDRRFPRVQIATIEDLLDGRLPDLPLGLGLADAPTFRRAPRRRSGGGAATEPML